MRPNHHIRSFTGLGGDWETVCNLFRRLNRDFKAKLGLEFVDDWLQSASTLVVHPDQKLAVGPRESVERHQTDKRHYPQRSVHGEGKSSRGRLHEPKP